MKLSLLIPVGRFSFFVHACLQNVFETCGAPDDLDFVFLTSKKISPVIEKAFKEAAPQYPFRVLSAPFDAGSNHLQLLDWAVREGELTDWVIVQHSDLFWKEQDWLHQIARSVRPDLVLLCVPCPSRFSFRPTSSSLGKNIPIVGDFFGVYNRRKLVELSLFFKWGTLGEDVEVSEEVIEAVQTGLIYRERAGHPIEFGREFMDGSQAMAWELAVHYPQGIGHVLSPDSFHHLVAFFRIADSIQREGNMLKCNFPIGLDSYAMYAYLTSFCIERDEVEPIVMPWRWFSHFAHLYGHDVKAWRQFGEWLRRYSRASQVVGEDDLGLDLVDFNGERLSTRLIKFI